jgi:CO/xanthine dehydrogenase FAD-binding subunit
VTVTNVTTYQRPSSLEEAWGMLTAGGRNAKLVGGGVDVGRFAPPEITTLIDVTGLPVRSIALEEGGRLVLGAAVTLTELLESPEAERYLDGILVNVLRQVASPLLRNAATVGGSLAAIHPWSDVITLLVALGAQVTRYSGQEESVSLETLLAQRGTVGRYIITRVTLPGTVEPTLASFEKFSRTGFDVGMLNCACRITMDGEVCRDVKIVFGGTPDIGARLEPVEKELEGKRLTSEVIEAAGAKASATIPARDDVRASGEYRRVLAGVGVRRCLFRIAQKVGEQG